MKTIKLLGSKPKGHPFPIFSWLIRFFEFSKISHVGVLFCDENKVFDAHFNKFRFEKLSDFTDSNTVVYTEEIKVTDDQYRNLLEMKDSKLGDQKGYFITILGALIPLIIRNLSFGLIKSIPNLAIGKKGYTCSMLAREVVVELGLPDSLCIDYKIDKWNYTTKDAVKLYRNLKEMNS